DFGIAKALAAAKWGERPEGAKGPREHPEALTVLGSSLGTPAYMAPEQAAGDPDVDHRADLYAWGIVAYELLAGAHPFSDRTTAGALVAAHIRDTPVSLATRASGVPPRLATIVDRALEKDPLLRPASAAEIVRALDEIDGADQ